MTLRVALGSRPMFTADRTKQIVIPSPILTPTEMAQLEAQAEAPVKRFDMLFDHVKVDSDALEGALSTLCGEVEATVRAQGGIIMFPTAMSAKPARPCRLSRPWQR